MSWTQLGLDIDGEAPNDQSGFSVSLSVDGNTVAIGANLNDGNGSNSGHVRVYRYVSGVWGQLGVDINGEASTNQSGYSVSLSGDGNTVAIGAPLNDNANGTDSGHVGVYRYNGTAWVQLGSDIDGESGLDRSGWSVSLSNNGNIVAIGAYGNDGISGSNSDTRGHVRVYEFNGTSWVQLGSDIDGEVSGDQSGWSVSLSDDGNIVAIGARLNDAGNSITDNRGHVRVYEFNGTSWVKLGSDIDGEARSDNSGWSVSLSGDGKTVAAGAYLNDGANGTDSGNVRVYRYNGTAWIQLGSDIDGEATGDQSGFSVSLSVDGNTVAIGANLNDGNGSDSGHVRIYTYNPSLVPPRWEQLDGDFNGETLGNNSGWSVSLSADGKTVVVGAPNNAGNGSNNGHVRVYRFIEPIGAPSYEGLLASLSIISALFDCDTNGLVENNIALTILNQLFQSGTDGYVSWYNIGGTANGGPATISNPYLLAHNGYPLTTAGFNCFKDFKYYFYGKCYVQQSTTFTIDVTNPCVISAYQCLGIPVNSNQLFSSVCARFAGWLSGQTRAQGKYIYESTLEKVMMVFKGFCEVIKQRVLAERVYVKGKRTISDCAL